MKFEVIALFSSCWLWLTLLVAPPPAEARFEIGSPGSGSYSYSWQVSDTGSGNEYGHSERRGGGGSDGDPHKTEGEYFVRLPDGRLQTVTYYVSPYSGFRAKVLYEGATEGAPATPPSPFRRPRVFQPTTPAVPTAPVAPVTTAVPPTPPPHTSTLFHPHPIHTPAFGSSSPPHLTPVAPTSPAVQAFRRPKLHQSLFSYADPYVSQPTYHSPVQVSYGINHHHPSAISHHSQAPVTPAVPPPPKSHPHRDESLPVTSPTHRDPHFRNAKEMQSFDLSEPLFYISTKRIQPNSKKGKGGKVKHATMKNKSSHSHQRARRRPRVKQLPPRLYF